jgi:Bacteriophage probable baseplate hub protein
MTLSAVSGSGYVPAYALTINGSAIPAPLRSCVTSVRYQDGRQAADRVEVAIANPDLRWLREHVRGLGFSAAPTAVRVGPVGVTGTPAGLFDLDNSLGLSLGYAGGPLEDVFSGELTGLLMSFPNGGMPTLTIVAHDHLHRLAQGSAARGFGLLPDFLVASILSAENLLLPSIDPAIIGASTAIAALNFVFGGSGRKQRGQSDLQFLAEIAASYDADFWVEGDVLYLSRFLKEYTPRLTLTWGQSLLDFAPRISTVGQVAGVSMKFTLREIPLDFLVTIFWDFDHEHIGVSVLPGVAAQAGLPFSGPALTIIDQPITSPADITTSALKIYRSLRNRLNSRLTGSGSAIGDCRLRAGAVVRLEGLGPDFSGDYRITAATHTVDSGGYRTNFEVCKEILP